MGRTRAGAQRKGEPAGYHWCFTWNNPPPEWKEMFKNWPNLGKDPVPLPIVSGHPGYLAAGMEVAPDTGMIHVQGFCSFACQTKMSTLKNVWRLSNPEWHAAIQGIHWEICLHFKTWQEARLYGLKEGNDNLEFGTGSLSRKKSGKRSDIDIVREAILSKEVANVGDLQMLPDLKSYAAYCFGKEMVRLQVPRHDFVPIIMWISGRTGVGKSWEVRKLIRALEEMRGWRSWISFDASLKWFDNYEGQELALFDDFRAGGDFAKLLQITDRYLCRVPVKGSSVYWYPRYIFFTCNERIEDAFRSNSEHEKIDQFLRRVTESGGGIFDFNKDEDIALFKARLDGILVSSSLHSSSIAASSVSRPAVDAERLVPREADAVGAQEEKS